MLICNNTAEKLFIANKRLQISGLNLFMIILARQSVVTHFIEPRTSIENLKSRVCDQLKRMENQIISNKEERRVVLVSPNQVLTHAARAAAKQLNKHL